MQNPFPTGTLLRVKYTIFSHETVPHRTIPPNSFLLVLPDSPEVSSFNEIYDATRLSVLSLHTREVIETEWMSPSEMSRFLQAV